MGKGFSCIKAYLNHLEGRNHRQVTESHHAKGALTLQLLRADALLAYNRSVARARQKPPRPPSFCHKCQCPQQFKHNRTVEHQLVLRYLNARCCGRTYNSRSEYEEHRLSLVHLRKIMEADKAKEEKNETQEGAEEKEGEGD